MLDVYHRKNKTIKPPDSSAHRSVSADFSHVPAGEFRGDNYIPAADRSHFGVPEPVLAVRRSRPHVLADRFHSRVPEPVPTDRSHSRGVPADHSRGPADRSRGPTDRSRAPTDRSHAPTDRSRVRAYGPHSRVPADRSHRSVVTGVPADRSHHSVVTGVPAGRAHVDIANPEESWNNDDEDNISDNGGRTVTVRSARHSKSHGDPKSSQLNYYTGIWVDVLVDARNNYRKLIHTRTPFPERSVENLREAQNLLLEAIARYSENHPDELDDCMFFFFFFFPICKACSQYDSRLQ